MHTYANIRVQKYFRSTHSFPREIIYLSVHALESHEKSPDSR